MGRVPDELAASGDVALVDGDRDGGGRRRGGWWILVVVVVAVALFGTGVLVARGSDERDPDDMLTAAQQYVAEASSFRLEFDQQLIADESDGSGSVDLAAGSGEWADGRWRLSSQSQLGDTETVYVDGTTYWRGIPVGPDGETTEWKVYPVSKSTRSDVLEVVRAAARSRQETGAPDEAATVSASDDVTFPYADHVAVGLYLGGVPSQWNGPGAFPDPATLAGGLGDLHDPTLVRDDGSVVTVGFEVRAPGDIEEAYGSPIPEGHVELDLDPDGVPLAMRLSVRDGDNGADTAIRFKDWNEPISINAPARDSIDPSSPVDDYNPRSIDGIVPVRPTAMPDDWQLVSVARDRYLGLECDVLSLRWTSAAEAAVDQDGQHLLMLLAPAACAMADPTEFEVGGFGDLPGRRLHTPDSAGQHVQVLVGDTVVNVTTSLGEEQLVDVLASLAPVDINTLLDELESSSAGDTFVVLS